MTATVKKIAIAVLSLLILASSFIYYNKYITQSRVDAANTVLIRKEPDEAPDVPMVSAEPALIKVHVAGAVNSPGLYEAEEGSRVADLIDLAGGGTADADLNAINLASVVSDGQKVNVPNTNATRVLEDMGDAAGGEYITESENIAAAHTGSSALININTAGQAELKSLPGIGDALSAAIMEYRDRNGGFRTLDDIKNVSGIGEKRYEQIRDLITIK